MRSAVVFGCEGLSLSSAEKDFFSETQPFGFILFARNVDTPDQVKRLCNELRSIVNDENTPILIDQEGGRVRRLRPPHWVDSFAMKPFGDLYEDNPDLAIELLQLQCDVQSSQFHAVGINVTCAPVLDTKFEYAHEVVGDRAFSQNPDIVSILGEIVTNQFLENGIYPIIKHIPGHGRANLDSHLALPFVDASRDDLQDIDFKPFKHVSSHTQIPMAMTAHIVYSSLDDTNCATMSKTIIQDVIRDQLGFKGLLFTDDLSMKALEGSYSEKTKACLDSGCDIILHCNGDMEEMIDVTKSLKKMSLPAWNAWQVAQKKLGTHKNILTRFEEETAVEKLRAHLK